MVYDLAAIGRGLLLFRYVVDSDEPWSEGGAAWARDAEQAKRVAAKRSQCECAACDTDRGSCIRVTHVPTALRPPAGICWPHVSGLMEAERAAGLVLEGENGCTSCSMCDLSDGEVEEWIECSDCGSCATCGHALDCSEYFPLVRVN